MITFDVAVIGSGPAGNTAVQTLKGCGKSIAWFEEASIQPEYPSFSRSEILKKYRAGGQQLILSKSPTAVGEPLAIGGGLDINAGIFQRPPMQVYKQWNLENSKSWSWEKIQNEFTNLENSLEISSTNLSDDSISKFMLKGCHELNWAYKAIPVLSLAYRRRYQKKNIDDLTQSNGSFFHSTRIHSIIFQNRKWILNCLCSGKKIQYSAKHVFLAAGALQTPGILFRSGLIPRLQSHFSYHPFIKVIAEFDQEICIQNPFFSPIQVKEFSPLISIGSSVTTKATLLTEMMKAGLTDLNSLKKYRSQAIFYASTSDCPKTFLMHTKWSQNPILFSFQQQSAEALKKVLYKLVEYCFAMGARVVYAGHNKISSLQDITLILKNTRPVTAIHLFSSLPMGSTKDSWVNLEGRLRNSENLYIIDGSILPGSPGVNPQETIMAFAQVITRFALAHLNVM